MVDSRSLELCYLDGGKWWLVDVEWLGFSFEILDDIELGCGPLTVTVTTRSIIFLVGDPYKPSIATVTGRGPPTI